MMRHNWEENYQQGDTPWDGGEPEPLLVEAVETSVISPGRTLEIGCGTGTNVRFLTQAGFLVVGVDLSPTAIERARKKATSQKASFQVLDIMTSPLPEGPFDLVFDRGCFHVFGHPNEQALFARKVAEVLRPGGCWLSLIGSTEGPPREYGPPRRTALDIVTVVEPALEILTLRAANFTDTHGTPRAWFCLFRRREEPAQKSTPYT